MISVLVNSLIDFFPSRVIIEAIWFFQAFTSKTVASTPSLRAICKKRPEIPTARAPRDKDLTISKGLRIPPEANNSTWSIKGCASNKEITVDWP